MTEIASFSAAPQAFINNMKRMGYHDLLPIQRKVLEAWFNGSIPRSPEDVQKFILNSMANNIFIASATGSGKTLSATLPLALEAFAGLDFAALFVVPTTHLLTQTYKVLQGLFADVPSIKVVLAIDCLAATLYEEPSLLKLNTEVIAAIREEVEVIQGTGADTRAHRKDKADRDSHDSTVDNYLVKRLVESLELRLGPKFLNFRNMISYSVDKTSYFICGTPGIVSALITSIKPVQASEDSAAQNSDWTNCLKLRHVVIDETDHILLNDNTAFLVLIRELFTARDSTAIFRVPQFFAQRHRLSLPPDRFVFLSATIKYRVSLLENMGLHGGSIIDLNMDEDVRLALSPNVEHYLIQFKREYSEIDIAYLAFRCLCEPSGAAEEAKTSMLPCIIFTNSKHTMQRLAHMLFLFMMFVYKELRYKITLVSQTHTFKRPNFEAVTSVTNDALVDWPDTIILATDSFARGLDLPAIRSVVNFELPDSIATLTHRVGRCARGKNNGIAISIQRNNLDYQFETLVNFNPDNTVTVDEEDELCNYSSNGAPQMADFPIDSDDMLQITRRFSENANIYLTSLYDREFKGY